ncbi:hypothetical protein BD779DRAFT_817364 [Infundibulicybe gibba]|nr:hypothetical protein BD779DRAFT_817364 [Infundibulicybe gibba]
MYPPNSPDKCKAKVISMIHLDLERTLGGAMSGLVNHMRATSGVDGFEERFHRCVLRTSTTFIPELSSTTGFIPSIQASIARFPSENACLSYYTLTSPANFDGRKAIALGGYNDTMASSDATLGINIAVLGTRKFSALKSKHSTPTPAPLVHAIPISRHSGWMKTLS